jgi:hypothetical protein
MKSSASSGRRLNGSKYNGALTRDAKRSKSFTNNARRNSKAPASTCFQNTRYFGDRTLSLSLFFQKQVDRMILYPRGIGRIFWRLGWSGSA